MSSLNRNIALLQEPDPQHDDLQAATCIYRRLPAEIQTLTEHQYRLRNLKLPKNRIEKHPTGRIAEYIDLVLEVLPDDQEWRSTRTIADLIYRIRGSVHRDLVRRTCNLLVAEKKLQQSHQGLLTVYRHLKKHFEVGDCVVECRGTRSERYGIIEEFQYIKRKGLFPIVRWQNDTRSFSSEDLIEHV